MADAFRTFVHRRAAGRCEYCHLPEAGHEEKFSLDHIVARQHGGSDDTDNLALCCLRCNLYKGTNLSGIDPASHSVTTLFHPRNEDWQMHFRWKGSLLTGSTSTGRTTVATLHMNSPERVRLRELLMAEGIFFVD